MRILDRFIRAFLAFVISLYQKYISPSKGFHCAYHDLHAGETCSQYTKRILLEQDLITAISLSQQRFSQCSEAALKLSQEQKKKQLSSNSILTVNLPKLRGRRYFLLVAVPAFLTVLASPAWAGRSSRGIASCAGRSAQAGYREDSKDGNCGDPNIWYGICCGLSIIGASAGTDK